MQHTMKKIMMTAVMAAMTASAFGQASVVKQAQKLLDDGDINAALETLEPALTTGTDAEKASAWNLQAELNYQIFMDGQQVQVENQVKQTSVPYDTASMHAGMVAAFKAAQQCDVYDNMPDEKGKVKPKYRTDNQTRYYSMRPNLINAGMYEYNKKNMDKAIEIWRLYIDSADDPLFTGLDMTQDPYRAEIAYYVGLASYQQHDYETAVQYAQMAAEDSVRAKDASEILLFSQKETCKNKADTLAYVETVKALHKQYPEETRYFNMISEVYANPGYTDEMLAWCEEEIALDPSNAMPYALKGEVLMNQQKWDEAVEAYKQAVEVDPDFVQVIFNIGVCLNSKAISIKDASADAQGRLTNEAAEKVKAVLTESKTYLEKARELDPNHEATNWPYPLYQIYYSLGDTEKAAEMEQILGGN